MAEPESGDDDATGTRRHRRHHRNRRARQRVRRVLGVTAAAGALVAGGAFVLIATDVLRPSGDTKPSLAGTVEETTLAPVTSTTTPTGSTCRALTADNPLRLWVGGDSLAGSLGPALGDIAGATGVVQPYFDSRVSSGLDNPGFFNWPDHASSEMARLDPEVVVFVIGTNDWSAVDNSGWKADYAKQVDAMLHILVGDGRTVYWVGAPALRDQQKDDAVKQVNEVAANATKRYQSARYFDEYTLFADSNGGFAFNHADDTGKVVTMRTGDGVHLTTDGANYLARHIYALLDKQCHVEAQRVADAPKHTIETEGSTQVAPSVTTPGSSSSSGSSSGTIQTTPPATAPPTTTTVPVPVTTEPATTTPPPPSTTTPTITVPKLGASSAQPPR